MYTVDYCTDAGVLGLFYYTENAMLERRTVPTTLTTERDTLEQITIVRECIFRLMGTDIRAYVYAVDYFTDDRKLTAKQSSRAG